MAKSTKSYEERMLEMEKKEQESLEKAKRYREYVRPAELHSQSAEENCPTENVSSLRSVKGATLPCDACASIPCGLAVRKQHEMLFAASKFGKINTENQTVDWSHYAKS